VNRPRDAALRPLHAAWDARSTLREGAADAETARRELLRVGEAIESALRRLLRDEPAVPVETRLRALAPDELSAEELVSTLRRHDRVSIELAAGFHEVLRLRQRLVHGGEAAPEDARLVLGLAERVEREVMAAPAPVESPPSRASAPGGSLGEATLADPGAVDEPPHASAVSASAGTLPRYWVVLASGILVLFALGLWLSIGRTGPRLDEAIALFRTGDYERAAEQFEQHARARPGDPTPRLYLARIHRRLAQYDLAREQLRLGLEAEPDDAALHRELGYLLLDTGQADAAVGRFRGAVERDPESVEGWLGLVRALRENGQPEAAARVAARAPAEARALLAQRDQQRGSP
jgi:tetratricopeptide (TPR) repeat protein